MGFELTHDNYNRLVERISALPYSAGPRLYNLNVHQTIHFLIYQFRVAMGEIRLGPFHFLPAISIILPGCRAGKKHRKDFANEMYDTRNFNRDKELLLEKMKKAIMREEFFAWPPHLFFFGGSCYDYLSYLFRQIDGALNIFELATSQPINQLTS